MNQEIKLYNSEGREINLQDNLALVNPETGEEVHLRTIKKPYYGAKHFWKVYLGDLLAVMGFLDSKQIDVMCYVLSHTSAYNNQFQALQSEIAKACNCSEPTVRRTLKKMENSNLIKRTKYRSTYQVNPSIIIQGGEEKKLALMIEYEQLDDPDVIAEAAELGVLPNEIQLG